MGASHQSKSVAREPPLQRCPSRDARQVSCALCSSSAMISCRRTAAHQAQLAKNADIHHMAGPLERAAMQLTLGHSVALISNCVDADETWQ